MQTAWTLEELGLHDDFLLVLEQAWKRQQRLDSGKSATSSCEDATEAAEYACLTRASSERLSCTTTCGGGPAPRPRRLGAWSLLRALCGAAPAPSSAPPTAPSTAPSTATTSSSTGFSFGGRPGTEQAGARPPRAGATTTSAPPRGSGGVQSVPGSMELPASFMRGIRQARVSNPSSLTRPLPSCGVLPLVEVDEGDDEDLDDLDDLAHWSDARYRSVAAAAAEPTRRVSSGLAPPRSARRRSADVPALLLTQLSITRRVSHMRDGWCTASESGRGQPRSQRGAAAAAAMAHAGAAVTAAAAAVAASVPVRQLTEFERLLSVRGDAVATPVAAAGVPHNPLPGGPGAECPTLPRPGSPCLRREALQHACAEKLGSGMLAVAGTPAVRASVSAEAGAQGSPAPPAASPEDESGHPAAHAQQQQQQQQPDEPLLLELILESMAARRPTSSIIAAPPPRSPSRISGSGSGSGRVSGSTSGCGASNSASPSGCGASRSASASGVGECGVGMHASSPSHVSGGRVGTPTLGASRNATGAAAGPILGGRIGTMWQHGGGAGMGGGGNGSDSPPVAVDAGALVSGREFATLGALSRQGWSLLTGSMSGQLSSSVDAGALVSARGGSGSGSGHWALVSQQQQQHASTLSVSHSLHAGACAGLPATAVPSARSSAPLVPSSTAAHASAWYRTSREGLGGDSGSSGGLLHSHHSQQQRGGLASKARPAPRQSGEHGGTAGLLCAGRRQSLPFVPSVRSAGCSVDALNALLGPALLEPASAIGARRSSRPGRALAVQPSRAPTPPFSLRAWTAAQEHSIG